MTKAISMRCQPKYSFELADSLREFKYSPISNQKLQNFHLFGSKIVIYLLSSNAVCIVLHACALIKDPHHQDQLYYRRPRGIHLIIVQYM